MKRQSEFLPISNSRGQFSLHTSTRGAHRNSNGFPRFIGIFDNIRASATRDLARVWLQGCRGRFQCPTFGSNSKHAPARGLLWTKLATSHYRGRNLAEKVRAGLSIYAHAEDASRVRRVLDQRELTAEILSL